MIHILDTERDYILKRGAKKTEYFSVAEGLTVDY